MENQYSEDISASLIQNTKKTLNTSHSQLRFNTSSTDINEILNNFLYTNTVQENQQKNQQCSQNQEVKIAPDQIPCQQQIKKVLYCNQQQMPCILEQQRFSKQQELHQLQNTVQNAIRVSQQQISQLETTQRLKEKSFSNRAKSYSIRSQGAKNLQQTNKNCEISLNNQRLSMQNLQQKQLQMENRLQSETQQFLKKTSSRRQSSFSKYQQQQHQMGSLAEDLSYSVRPQFINNNGLTEQNLKKIDYTGLNQYSENQKQIIIDQLINQEGVQQIKQKLQEKSEFLIEIQSKNINQHSKKMQEKFPFNFFCQKEKKGIVDNYGEKSYLINSENKENIPTNNNNNLQKVQKPSKHEQILMRQSKSMQQLKKNQELVCQSNKKIHFIQKHEKQEDDLSSYQLHCNNIPKLSIDISDDLGRLFKQKNLNTNADTSNQSQFQQLKNIDYSTIHNNNTNSINNVINSSCILSTEQNNSFISFSKKN